MLERRPYWERMVFGTGHGFRAEREEKVPRILQKFGGSKLRRLAAQLRHFCSDVRPFISKLEAQLCTCAPFETTDQGDCYRELRRITLPRTSLNKGERNPEVDAKTRC